MSALGATPRLFLHLKVDDSPKTEAFYGMKFDQHRETSASNVKVALREPWLRELLEEAVVVPLPLWPWVQASWLWDRTQVAVFDSLQHSVASQA